MLDAASPSTAVPSPSGFDGQLSPAKPAAAEVVDIWRACARVLNRVPQHLVERPDGSVFFMLDMPEGMSVSDLQATFEPVTVQDEDGELCVVDTVDDGDSTALLAHDTFGPDERYMLVELRGSYSESTGGLVEVTVLPQETSEASAIEQLKSLQFVDDVEQELEPEHEQEVDDEAAENRELIEQALAYRQEDIADHEEGTVPVEHAPGRESEKSAPSSGAGMAPLFMALSIVGIAIAVLSWLRWG